MGLQDHSIFGPKDAAKSQDQACDSSECFLLWHVVVAAALPSFVALVLALHILRQSNATFRELCDSVVSILEKVGVLKRLIERVTNPQLQVIVVPQPQPDVERIRPVNVTDDFRVGIEARRQAYV